MSKIQQHNSNIASAMTGTVVFVVYNIGYQTKHNTSDERSPLGLRGEIVM